MNVAIKAAAAITTDTFVFDQNIVFIVPFTKLSVDAAAVEPLRAAVVETEPSKAGGTA
jgi:hypothetical protein